MLELLVGDALGRQLGGDLQLGPHLAQLADVAAGVTRSPGRRGSGRS
jgi:hypothetical protein